MAGAGRDIARFDDGLRDLGHTDDLFHLPRFVRHDALLRTVLGCREARVRLTAAPRLDHHPGHVGHRTLRLPAEPLGGPRRIGPATAELARPREGRIVGDVSPPVEPQSRKDLRDELLEAEGRAGRDHIILRLVTLEHRVHRDHVLRSPAPVAADRQVAKRERPLLTGGDAAGRGHDLLRHEPFRAERTLVVEENSRAGGDAVGPPVLVDLPKRRRLGDAVGAAWPQRRRFAGRDAAGIAEHLRAPCIVEADRAAEHPNHLQQVHRADDDAFERLHGLIERQPDRGLACEVVDFVGLMAGDGLHGRSEINERHRNDLHAVANAQLLESVEPTRLCVAARADDAVAEPEEMTCQIGAVLAADPADQGGAPTERCLGRHIAESSSRGNRPKQQKTRWARPQTPASACRNGPSWDTVEVS